MIAPHDLQSESAAVRPALRATRPQVAAGGSIVAGHYHCVAERAADLRAGADPDKQSLAGADTARAAADPAPADRRPSQEEHTSGLQYLMRNSTPVHRLKHNDKGPN